jgi:hydroxymethylbilane synthase
MRLVGMCGLPDGTRILHAEVGGARDQAQLMGEKLAEDLLGQGAAEILAATR